MTRRTPPPCLFRYNLLLGRTISYCYCDCVVLSPLLNNKSEKTLFIKMPRIVKCCVLNCADTTSVRHRFPIKEKDVFKVWKERAQHPRFDKITDEHIYKVYMMCGAHFKADDGIPHSKKLKKRILPTINIPGLDTTVKMIENFASNNESAIHDYDEVPARVDVTDKSVKRKAEELHPESTSENTAKKRRFSCEKDQLMEETVINNESGILIKYSDGILWCGIHV